MRRLGNGFGASNGALHTNSLGTRGLWIAVFSECFEMLFGKRLEKGEDYGILIL